MSNRLHRHLASACLELLEAVFRNGAVADRVVGQALKSHPKWGSRDRGFVAETVYEVVRWRRRLAWLAASDEPQTAAGMHWTLAGFPRPDWAEWPEISAETLAARQESLAGAPRAVRESISDELDALGYAGLGAAWDRELTALNCQAPVFLRVNPLRSSIAAVTAILSEKGIAVTPVEGAPLALRVTGSKSIPAALRQSGWFEIQDAASQQVAPFLQPEAGQCLIDACAGAGGKSLHLAALTGGRAEITGLDVSESRLAALRKRAETAGARVRTAVAGPEILTRLHKAADRVLVDAPCSGSGTLRRQPDLKYRITAQSVRETCDLQRELLSRFATLVRPGGKLVYATCSVFPCENGEQSAWFSREHPEFIMEEQRAISPAATGWDGFYMARWQRN